MQIERDEQRADVAVLRLSDELSGNDAEAMINDAEAEINRGLRHLIIDCTALRHVSSSGLGVLIRIHHRLRRRRGDVKLVGTDGMMKEALEMTRLNLVFPVYESIEDALGAITA